MTAPGIARVWMMALSIGCPQPEPPPVSQPVHVSVGDPSPGPEILDVDQLPTWIRQDLEAAQAQVLVAALNLSPAPCAPCGSKGMSLAQCVAELPEGCENVPVLIERGSARLAVSQAEDPNQALDGLREYLAHEDIWVPEAFGASHALLHPPPAGQSVPTPIPVEVWIDPGSPFARETWLRRTTLAQMWGDRLTWSTRIFTEERRAKNPIWALGALAAAEVGSLTGFFDALTEQESSHSNPRDIAVAAGMDPNAWETASTNTELPSVLTRSATEAARLGVRATPTWWIAGYRLNGLREVEALDAELKRARISPERPREEP